MLRHLICLIQHALLLRIPTELLLLLLLHHKQHVLLLLLLLLLLLHVQHMLLAHLFLWLHHLLLPRIHHDVLLLLLLLLWLKYRWAWHHGHAPPGRGSVEHRHDAIRRVGVHLLLRRLLRWLLSKLLE